MNDNKETLTDEEFEEIVADHFEWCDDCGSSREAYRHEMQARDL